MKNLPIIEMTTQELASKAYMGDKVFINGNKKSYWQLKRMKNKTYTVSIEHKGAINMLKGAVAVIKTVPPVTNGREGGNNLTQ